ncbi:Hypothetical protein A7982_01064 [Minicystis rosea]|nr:Hypothetical protein A7982_01064 [Minicystis rosea]
MHEARVENLERLALALGVRLPPRQGRDRNYARKLVRAVLRGLEEDRRKNRTARPMFSRAN